MNKLVLFGAIFLCFLFYGIFLSHFQLNLVEVKLEPQNPPGFYDYKGVTNAHTSLKKGSLPAQDIVLAGQEAGLDFLFFTDHNYFGAPPIRSAYHDNLLVFWEGSYSYLDSQILYFDSSQKKNLSGLGDVQVQFSDHLSKTLDEKKDGFLVLAHPIKKKETWKGPYPSGLDGIEVVNLKSVWRKAWIETRISFLWSFFVYPFNSHLALIRIFKTPEQEIELWDKLNRKQPTVGFVGNETTSRIVPGTHLFRFPSYQSSFGIASNHLLLRSELTGNFKSDREKVYEALRKGQFYMSLDFLSNPKGFVTYIKDSAGKIYPLGSRIPFRKGLKLIVRLPQKPTTPFEVVVKKNGYSYYGSHSAELEVDISSPGAYRTIVRVIPTFPLPDGKQWMTWIYTNPFFVQ